MTIQKTMSSNLLNKWFYQKTERRDGHFVVISILFSKPKSASYRALWPCILNLLDGENLENSQIWNSYCSTCGQGGICILNIPVLWIQDTPHHHSINSSPVHLVFLQATNQRVPQKTRYTELVWFIIHRSGPVIIFHTHHTFTWHTLKLYYNLIKWRPQQLLRWKEIVRIFSEA